MEKKNIQFDISVYKSVDELTAEDKMLITAARASTKLAYAPYSHFHVGAVAMLNNGEMVNGSNQENAAYSVSVCAERTLLSSDSLLFPQIPIKTMAIAYHNINGKSDVPISPCGVCRQSMIEYQDRANQSIRLILSGMEGEVFIVDSASSLLPLSFRGKVLLGD
jgi:cytidine deaminase